MFVAIPEGKAAGFSQRGQYERIALPFEAARCLPPVPVALIGRLAVDRRRSGRGARLSSRTLCAGRFAPAKRLRSTRSSRRMRTPFCERFEFIRLQEAEKRLFYPVASAERLADPVQVFRDEPGVGPHQLAHPRQHGPRPSRRRARYRHPHGSRMSISGACRSKTPNSLQVHRRLQRSSSWRGPGERMTKRRHDANASRSVGRRSGPVDGSPPLR